MRLMDNDETNTLDRTIDRAQILLNRLEGALRGATAEQQRQYWAFTRTARGKPVSPAVCTEVEYLSAEVSKLRSWLRRQIERTNA